MKIAFSKYRKTLLEQVPKELHSNCDCDAKEYLYVRLNKELLEVYLKYFGGEIPDEIFYKIDKVEII